MDEQQSTVWCLESRDLEYTGHCRNRYHLENELLLERLGYSPQE